MELRLATRNNRALDSFAEGLSNYARRVQYDFPWRLQRTPYRVLVSEVMLTKTTASQVAGLYSDFIDSYPDPISLSRASVACLHGLLRPLGLFSRAETLVHIGSVLVSSHNGEVPRERESLLAIKGIGPYIANATLSFGFGKAVPIVDTGIARLIDRFFGGIITVHYAPYRDPAAWALADEYIRKSLDDSARANYALLDTARTICVARAPRCEACPLRRACAYAAEKSTPATSRVAQVA